MYRKRLIVKTGCIRCKTRRKKCDERHPVCSFCKRWSLPCIWPSQSSRPPDSRIDRQSADYKAVQIRAMINDQGQPMVAELGLSALDPFHKLPISSRESGPEVTNYLHDFFTNMISNAMPFDFASVQCSMGRGWAQNLFADASVCYTLIAHCMERRMDKATVAAERSLHFETKAVRMLIGRLNKPGLVSEGTLLSAAMHFVVFVRRCPDASEIRRVANGIGAMVQAHGGHAALTHRFQDSTLLSLEICDTLNSFWNATPPLFNGPGRPETCPSFDLIYAEPSYHIELAYRLGPFATDLLRNLHFILFFRNPSKQTRRLTTNEASYLHNMLRYTDNQLGLLQAQVVGQSSVAEIAIVAMVLLRFEVIAGRGHHVLLVEAVLRRLRHAILTTDTYSDDLGQTISIWASVVALVGSSVQKERIWFSRFFAGTLSTKHGVGCQPSSWRYDLEKNLKCMPWHDSLQKSLERQYEVIDAELGYNENPRL